MLTDDRPADLVLDALGNQTRRDILTLLKDKPMTVGTIATHLPVSRPAVSKHLRILEHADLVAYEPNGRRNIFYLQPTGFRQASLYLNTFWDDALAKFQQIAEETAEAE